MTKMLKNSENHKKFMWFHNSFPIVKLVFGSGVWKLQYTFVQSNGVLTVTCQIYIIAVMAQKVPFNRKCYA